MNVLVKIDFHAERRTEFQKNYSQLVEQAKEDADQDADEVRKNTTVGIPRISATTFA